MCHEEQFLPAPPLVIIASAPVAAGAVSSQVIGAGGLIETLRGITPPVAFAACGILGGRGPAIAPIASGTRVGIAPPVAAGTRVRVVSLGRGRG